MFKEVWRIFLGGKRLLPPRVTWLAKKASF